MNPREEYREEHKERWDAMEAHLDQLLELRKNVVAGDRILLVGRNASGKSLFRNLLNDPTLTVGGKKIKMVHSSMALRTGHFSSLGALSNMFGDNAEDATSDSSLKIMEAALRNCQRWLGEGSNCGLHIDEPEVGCSEELQLSIGPWLRKRLDELTPPPTVTMITTHSRRLAENFRDWKFIDTGFEYPDIDAWLNREVKPMDIEELQLNAHTLFLVIVERQEKGRASKK